MDAPTRSCPIGAIGGTEMAYWAGIGYEFKDSSWRRWISALVGKEVSWEG
jgi:hypothetical protein